MILPPKNISAHLPSTWAAAICATMLAVGGHGATRPLLSETATEIFLDIGEEVEMVEFNAPGDPAPAESVLEEEPEVEEVVEEDIEIPPLPEIVPPLTPPEMPDLAQVEEIRPPEPKPPEPKPEPKPVEQPPKPKPKPKVRPKPRATAPSTSAGTGTGGSGGSGPPTVFSGGGRGRFPAPSYPSSARSAGAQGTVRLMVVVESSGMPSSVSVMSSSGSSDLDSSAVSTIKRRWRWPKGNVRRYIVPIRYVLNQ